ncbi:MAG: AAA family ATPase [bacterium]|nr:AAA family ATPase [bacterium]
MQGYTLEELLHQSSGFSLYRARPASSGSQVQSGSSRQPERSVILKILHKDLPEPEDLAGLRHERDHTPAVGASPEVVRVLDLEQRGGVLVLEDPGGELLKSAMRRTNNLAERLDLAIALARTLAQLHRRGVIHKNLNPYTVFVRRPAAAESGVRYETLLTGFEFSSRLSRQGNESVAPNALRGAPAYISPEQTGRMNQFVDQRSDLYSLGVLLYEIFAGRHPFPGARDTLAWVHCHLAREPAELSQHRDGSKVPAAVASVVLKLLAKASGERYQSVRGLLFDLELCRDAGQSEPPDFVAGARDRPERLQLAQNLYGRTKELDRLLDDFAAVAAGGRRLVFVTGASGTGKSALIEELHRPVVSQSGAFLNGKYDQFERGVPYSALIQAFGQIIRRILSEDNENLSYWRERILGALRSNAGVLTPVLPDLGVLLGSQPPVQDLPPAESRNRFHNVFGEFVAAFAGLHHPLVIFLDDLQWADPASLDFLQSLIYDREIPYLQIVGSYRDTEREEDGPLDRMLRTIESSTEASKQAHTISLTGFALEDVAQLIADSLDRSPSSVRRLAGLVHERTLGNPFFVRQFLFEIYESKFLSYNHEVGEWRYDLEAIGGMPVTHNAAEFMARKIERLSYSATKALEVAACLGSEFEWGILSGVLDEIHREGPRGEQELDLATGMAEALHEGLILSNNSGGGGALMQPEFRFLHDRVQQAAYSLLGTKERVRIHFAAARYLMEQSGGGIGRGGIFADDERLFEIAGHLGAVRGAPDLHYRPGELENVVRLNFEAARRARLSGAIAEALDFIRTAREFQSAAAGLDAMDSISSTLSSDVEFEAIQCEYLNGNHEAAGEIYARAYGSVTDDEDRARLTTVMVTLDTNLGRLDEAVARGVRALRAMGLGIPLRPGVPRILWEAGRVRWLLRGLKIEDLVKHREMEDSRRRHQIDLLMSVAPAAFFTNQNLFAVIALKVVGLSLQYGNAPYSSYAYATYGVFLQSAFGESSRAAAFGNLGLSLNEGFDLDGLKCKLRVIYGSFINHWVADMRTSEEHLIEAYALGLEHGDLVYSGYALANRIFLLVTLGRPLDEVDDLIKGFLRFARRTGDRDVEGDFILVLQASRNLRGETRSLDEFGDEAYNESEHIQEMHTGNPITLFFYYMLRIRNKLIHRELQGIHTLLKAAAALQEPIRPLVLGHEFVYLRGLCEALCDDSPRVLRLLRLRRAIRKFEAWSRSSPATFRSRLLHLQAEYARIRGRVKAAGRLYSAAIEEAMEHGNLNVAAFAAEQAGRYFNRLGMHDVARLYLERAIDFYRHRGATAPVAALRSEFSYLLEGGLAGVNGGVAVAGQEAAGPSGISRAVHTGQNAGITSSGAMDVQSITRASRMISEEIVVGRLLEKIMDLLLKEAGARRGCLIRRSPRSDSEKDQGDYEDSRYVIVARGAPDKITVYSDGQSELLERQVQGNPELPQSLLQYVMRTGESVILNDVEQDRVYREDAYIRSARPRSLLCIPIRARGEITGLLYLENDLITGAFTEERLEVLGILSAQAAVSLENAILYDSLEQRVAERTAELGATLERVQELKVSQDCDYYLTALLIQPLSATRIESSSIQIHSLLRQMKNFQYKKWSEQIGGDINVARSIRLQGRSCTVFFQGDAMGKSLQGAGGALVFGAVVESLIAGTEVNVETAALDPAVWVVRSFQELHQVFESFRGYMMMSVMLGIIEDDTGRIHMVNGDHPPAVLYRDGRASFLDEIPITHKLGAYWYRRNVVNHEFQLSKGDVVLLGSDGRDDLVVGHDEAGEFQMNEDADLFLRAVEAGQGDVEAIFEEVRKSGEIKDDLSLMSIAYR